MVLFRFLFFLFCFCFGSHSILFSQDFVFSGHLLLEDSTKYPYKIHLYFDSLNQVSGTSTKTIQGVDYKCFIEGHFDKYSNALYFKEIITSGPSFSIDFQGTIGHVILNIFTIPGIIKTNTNKEGHINVICRDFKLKDYKSIPIATTKNEEDVLSKLKVKLIENNKSSDKFKSISGGEKVTVNFTETNAFLKIYDQMEEDNDKIEVKFNSKLLANNLTLTHAGFLYKIKLNKGLNTLTIKALNEGKVLFNTSKLELYNKTNHNYFVNVLSQNETVIYEIYF